MAEPSTLGWPATKGCLKACKNCFGFHCCGTLRKGGTIEPPFLTKYDVAQITRVTGLPLHAFTKERFNPYTGNTVLFLKTEKHTCVFFDRFNGNCQIHGIRPLDCLLFPLDIVVMGDRYFWVIYNYKHCHLSSGDISSLLRLRKWALWFFGPEVHDFATIPVPGMAQLERELHGELRLE